MTAYVVIKADGLNRVITVPSGIVAYDVGDCLLFAATRDRKTLIGVVLHSSRSVNGLPVAGSDATKLLNWAFAH